MTAESLGIRMKSYYDSGHLCRISYQPRARIADGWSSSSRRRPSELSPLFIGGDTGISTARVTSHSARALPAHQLPGTMGTWMDRVESNYKMEPSDQES